MKNGNSVFIINAVKIFDFNLNIRIELTKKKKTKTIQLFAMTIPPAFAFPQKKKNENTIEMVQHTNHWHICHQKLMLPQHFRSKSITSYYYKTIDINIDFKLQTQIDGMHTNAYICD